MKTFTRAHVPIRVPAFLKYDAKYLRRAKTKLLQSYKKEQYAAARGGSTDLWKFRCTRATAERDYVTRLIGYYRAGNWMTAAQATQLQENFTREKMGKNGNVVAPPCPDYLMSMYPREVN